MNRWSYIVLVVLLAAITFVGYHYRHWLIPETATQSGTATKNNSSQTEISWQKLDRSRDGFLIEMPANPQQTRIPAYNEHGGTEQADMLYAYPDPQICFSITWEENPPVVRINKQAPGRALDMALADALDRSQTTLVTGQEMNQQGFPGRDFSARNAGGGVLNSRLVLARHRLYMLTATYPSADTRRDEDVARFFNSFSVVAQQ